MRRFTALYPSLALLSFGVALMLACPVKADQQVVSAVTSFVTTAAKPLRWEGNKLTLPGFDPALGTLSNVNIAVDWTATNLGTKTLFQTLFLEIRNNVRVQNPDTSILFTAKTATDKVRHITNVNLNNWSFDDAGLYNQDVPANLISQYVKAGNLDFPLTFWWTVIQYAGTDTDWFYSGAGGTIKLTATYTYSATIKNPSSVSVSDARSAIGRDALLKGTLLINGAVASGKTLAFQVDGTTVASATTDGTGTASIPYRITSALSVGKHVLNAVFAGDANTLSATSANGNLQVTPGITTFVVNAITGRVGSVVRLVAYLRNSAIGIPNKTVAITVDGKAAGSLTTDGNGRVVLNYTIPDNLSSTTPTIGASFAGDASFSASTGSNILTVTPFDTEIYVPDRTIAKGRPGALRIRLSRTDKVVIAGRLITFKLNGVVVGTGVTDTSGNASLNITAPATAGSYPIVAQFAGDIAYNASTGSGTLTVTN